MPLDLRLLVIFFVAVVVTGGLAIWRPYWAIGLFVSTSLIKSVMRAYFPFLVSYTFDIMVAGLAFIAILANYSRTRDLPRLSWDKTLFICYAVMVALTLLLYPFTRAPEAGFKKLLIFTIYICISLLIPTLFLRTEQNVRQLVRLMLIIGIIAAIGTMFFPSKMYGAEDYTRDTFLHGNPLGPSDATGLACIVVVAFWLIGKKVWWTVLIPFLVAGFMVTGSRGPIFGLGACVLLFLYIARSKAFLQALLIGPIVYVLLYFAIGLVQEQAGDRFTADSMGTGMQDRVVMVQASLKGWWSNNPMGGGPGDCAYILTGGDNYAYPHNSLVEALCDLGPMGFACLLIVYCLVLHRLFLLRRRHWGQSPLFMQIAIIGGAALYYLLLTFKTGSFYGSFLVWFYFSAFLHCCLRFSPEPYFEGRSSESYG